MWLRPYVSRLRSGHVTRRFSNGQFRPLDDLGQTHARLVLPDHLLWIENDSHEILGVVLFNEAIGIIGRRKNIVLKLDAISVRITVVHGDGRPMIDGPVGFDAQGLEALIVRQQLPEMAISEGDVFETGPRSGLAGYAGYLHNSDSMMLGIVSEKANGFILILNASIQGREVPVARRFEPRGA